MNTKERELVALLKTMREKYGVLGVKAEFEAEGTRMPELLRLKDVSSKAGGILALKIGGPEDVWGIEQAMDVGVDEIVAPMVEGSYALKKFMDAFKKVVNEDEREDTVAAVNVETAQTYGNIDALIETGVKNGLHGVTVGRVDLIGSMGLKRDSINSPKVFKITESICRKAKAAGLRTVVGGGIEKESFDFIRKLTEANLIDRFETRKIIFDAKVAASDQKKYEDGVRDAHRFEDMWLHNKQGHYSKIAGEDKANFEKLAKRIAS